MLPKFIVEAEKNSKAVHSLAMFSRRVSFKLENINQEFWASLRNIGISSSIDKRIEGYKNKYAGERCFIIATGPSLTISDCELLKDEYTFGMNSLCLALDDTQWRPTFFGIQDVFVYNKMDIKLLSLKLDPMFIDYDIYKKKKELHIPEVIPFHCNAKYHGFEQIFEKKYFAKFSDDCFRLLYDGYSITYSLLQIAIYLGFKEIYLLGVDCNYEAGKQHFVESGHFDKSYASAGDRMIVAFEAAKEYADKVGVKIFNATRGGKLEVFPRVKLEDVLLKTLI